MSTELKYSGQMIDLPTSAVREGEGEQKVTFTPEQQAKIDEIIRERMGAAGREGREAAEAARNDLKTEKAKREALEAEIAALKKKAPTGGSGDEIELLKAQIAEMRAAGESVKAETERLRQATVAKDKELEQARQQALDIRRENALREAASKANFLEVDVVTTLTKNSVKWDETKQRWTVLNESGNERLNSAYEPMSLDEFYAEYASKKPYMVRGDVRPGVGSAESNRGVSNNGKYSVEQIFGPKSNGAFALKLKKDNPAEYARLKGVAREAGLIN